MRAGQRGRISKTPVQSRRYSGKDGAALGAGLVADCDDVGESRSRGTGFKNVEHRLSSLVQDINPDLAHRFDCNWVECARLQSRAVRFKIIATNIVEKCFSHLAAGAVMDTDEENFLFHDHG